MRLTLGPRSYDLTSRALVVGAAGAPGDPVADGADLVEAGNGAPVYATAADDAGLDTALAGGAVVVHLPRPTREVLRRCAEAGVAVVVPGDAVAAAVEAGLPVDRVAPDSLLLDVTTSDCPMAAAAVGVVRGARIVRTDDVRGARRIADVLAAVLEAR